MPIACSHLNAASTPRVANVYDAIHKDQCTLCFEDQDSENGINVCLTCFNGGCTGAGTSDHSALHFEKTRHQYAVNIKRIPKDTEQPPKKITKLAIEAESEANSYSFETKVICHLCNDEIDAQSLSSHVNAIMAAMSSRKQSEVKAWEEEIVACAHTRELKQGSPNPVPTTPKCNDCDLGENMWLCLVCGNLGCGRQQFGGLGGNGHGVKHFEMTGHQISCKLGTITPEGTADIFCYTCGEERIDPDLTAHLKNFSINVASQEKTEKSMAELQLEQNLKFDFSMVTDDGKLFTPLFGPGYTGLENLGNTCYMASTLQVLFSQRSILETYGEAGQAHIKTCRDRPADCFTCQMTKMCEGLSSGRFSAPVIGDDGEIQGQKGISPYMFKSLLGKGHPEFSTMRQQDAQEYFQHVLKVLEQKERAAGNNSSAIFQLVLEQRLQCIECQCVRHAVEPKSNLLTLSVPANKLEDGTYAPTTFQQCLDLTFGLDARTFDCPVCKKQTTLTSQPQIVTFPEVLVTPLNRFVLGKNYVMEKLNVNVDTPFFIDLEAYRKQPPNDGEKAFPNDVAAPAAPAVDNEVVAQLEMMGFPRARCIKALEKTGNNGADIAMNWLLENMDDDGFESAPAEASSNDHLIEGITELGFTVAQAKFALSKTNNDPQRAVDWLFNHPEEDGLGAPEGGNASTQEVDIAMGPTKYELIGFISHRGTSAHCGHYVAHLKKGDQWVLYNDCKVVEVPDVTNAVREGYMYVFQRVHN